MSKTGDSLGIDGVRLTADQSHAAFDVQGAFEPDVNLPAKQVVDQLPGVESGVFHAAEGMLIAFTAMGFAPGFEVSKAGEIVVELSVEELSIHVVDETDIETFFGYIDADDPGGVLILV